MDPRDSAQSLSDRYRAAAEKHTSRPAIASRTAIAPVRDQENYNSHLRLLPPLPPTPPPAVARKPNPVVCTVPLNHCREAVPPSPTVTAGAALGRV